MKRLLSLEQARKEILELQQYINLVESYEVKSIESAVIKEYALRNNIAKVVANVNKSGIIKNGELLTAKKVSEIIRSQPMDDLHRLIRNLYLKKYINKRNKNIP